MVAMACLGEGLLQAPEYMLADALADGRLVEVLPHCRPKAMPISAVYTGALLLPQRLRMFLDTLEQLRDGPQLASSAYRSRNRSVRRAIR